METNATLPACPVGGERHLTPGEVELARTVFGDAVDYAPIKLKRRKFFPFQPKRITMAPCGHLHFHPAGHAYCDDFSTVELAKQGHLIHELTHVWQTQTHGDWYLLLRRHPFCRYGYSLKPGQTFEEYGIEQQAEIVKHAFWLRHGAKLAGVGDRAAFDVLVKFRGATL
ncbi:vgr related protein [Erythrobacter crassostreae]|uniref:Vgr related protein n=1 Tax=Erythrobacter crassostreae TaxID=2828328 RepID=A0A9X1F4A1_9SPHN|nr:vgr related protein [Erythrobacter crassostrea]MBV7259996.1 vgr related protein [Erythrobacter crassostrea]